MMHQETYGAGAAHGPLTVGHFGPIKPLALALEVVIV
jgi:hypothetical protein